MANGNNPKITADSTCAFDTDIYDCAETPGGIFFHSSYLPSPDNFAEVLFRPKGSNNPDSFNLAVHSRSDRSESKFYQAKFFNGWLKACIPTLLVINHVEFDRFESNLNSPPDCWTCEEYRTALGIPTDQAGFCVQHSDRPPPFPNDPIWLRIEVVDNEDGDPEITGRVAWGCMDGAGMESCTYYLTSRTDTGDPAGLAEVSGQWAIEPHDRVLLIDAFRAGALVP